MKNKLIPFAASITAGLEEAITHAKGEAVPGIRVIAFPPAPTKSGKRRKRRPDSAFVTNTKPPRPPVCARERGGSFIVRFALPYRRLLAQVGAGTCFFSFCTTGSTTADATPFCTRLPGIEVSGAIQLP